MIPPSETQSVTNPFRAWSSGWNRLVRQNLTYWRWPARRGRAVCAVAFRHLLLHPCPARHRRGQNEHLLCFGAVHRGIPLGGRPRRAYRQGVHCRHGCHGGGLLAGGEVIPGFLKPDANFGKSFLRLVLGKRLSLRCEFVETRWRKVST